MERGAGVAEPAAVAVRVKGLELRVKG